MDRRPLKVRGANWTKSLASTLARLGLTPNTISIFSVVFAAGVLITGKLAAEYRGFFIISALLVQLRLICNLIDGMVAVEHNQSSANGELFNDVPDRFADIFIILGGSLSISIFEGLWFSPVNLAWVGACLAVITAYVRVLGKSLGTSSYFIGPMAKQHRMFFMTLSFIVEYFTAGTQYSGLFLYSILILIILGSITTVFRRLIIISNDLKRG